MLTKSYQELHKRWRDALDASREEPYRPVNERLTMLPEKAKVVTDAEAVAARERVMAMVSGLSKRKRANNG